MNENHSAVTRLMYQLFIALGKKSVSTLVDTCSCGTPFVAKNFILTCLEHTDVLQAHVFSRRLCLAKLISLRSIQLNKSKLC